MSEVVEKPPRALTPAFITFMIIYTVLISIMSFTVVASAGGKAWTLCGFFIPPIYIFMILEVLGRISKRFRLNPTQLVIFLMTMWFIAGRYWVTVGGTAEFLHYLLWYGSPPALWSGVAAHPEWKEVLFMLPSWWIPHDLDAIKAAWEGKAPGVPINWGVWIAPIIMWSIVYIALIIIHTTIMFTIFGPQWTEVERIGYPLTIPTVFMSRLYLTRDEKGRSKLFTMKEPAQRVFWIGFIIASIISALETAGTYVPIGVLGAFAGIWGHNITTLPNYTRGILPGAEFCIMWRYLDTVLCIILPYSISVTAVVTWLIIGVIWHTIAVRTGAISYSPGTECWGQFYYGFRPPLPYVVWTASGFMFALGVKLAWDARDRIKRVFSTLRGPDLLVGDLSVKNAMYLFIIAVIVFLAIWSALGLNPIMAVIWFILLMAWTVSSARILEETPWCQPDANHGYYLMHWYVGAALGFWAWEPAQKNLSLLVANHGLRVFMNGRDVSHSADIIGYLYNMAYRLKASIKEVYTAVILYFAVLFPVLFTFNIWFWNHYGFKNAPVNGPGVGWQIPATLNSGVLAMTQWWYGGLDYSTIAIGTILGLLMFFGIPYLSRWIPLFVYFNAPTLISTLWLIPLNWFSALVGLVIKFVLTRILGPKRMAEIVEPLVAGTLVGMGFFYLVGAFIIIGTISIPNLQLYWRP